MHEILSIKLIFVKYMKFWRKYVWLKFYLKERHFITLKMVETNSKEHNGNNGHL